tara:strand:+ start:796 stop:1209 length:414 start_codon:yes stop_codon:yes gene_type:complete
MKIYFSGSIRGGRDDVKIYHQIITYLKSFGEVLTEHIGDSSLDSSGENNDNVSIHNKDMEFLMACDLVIAEVTNPSLGVGYEIGRAVEHNKKVICLYREIDNKKISAMILGSKDILSFEYQDLESLKKILSTNIKIS